MPAGNDAQAALAELADKFGSGAGRAEDLIRASNERYSGDLGVAQNQPLDEEATEEVREDLKAVAKAAGVKKVEDAAVRGDFVVYVALDKEGRAFKGCYSRASGSGESKSRTQSTSKSRSGSASKKT